MRRGLLTDAMGENRVKIASETSFRRLIENE
jgi:hypothetical protein